MWRAATAEEDAALTSARARRIAKELEGIKAAPVENVTAGPLDEADITVWQALLAGPPDSPYEGGEMAARWPAPRGSRGRGADAEEGAEAHGCARACDLAGQFKLEVRFPDNYPFEPPKVKFLTKVYHCNVSPGGDICMDILKRSWSPALTVQKVPCAAAGQRGAARSIWCARTRRCCCPSRRC
jgi:ubiquitin-protein ligase